MLLTKNLTGSHEAEINKQTKLIEMSKNKKSDQRDLWRRGTYLAILSYHFVPPFSPLLGYHLQNVAYTCTIHTLNAENLKRHLNLSQPLQVHPNMCENVIDHTKASNYTNYHRISCKSFENDNWTERGCTVSETSLRFPCREVP